MRFPLQTSSRLFYYFADLIHAKNMKGEECMRRKSCLLFVLGVAVISVLRGTFVNAADPANQQVDRYIDMLRTDLTAQKAAIIVSNLRLSEAETDAFWPVYRQYTKELGKVGDKKVAVIKDYAANFESIDNKKAKELTTKALQVEEQRLQVIKKYIKEFGKVLSAKQVAQFFQLEMQMQRLIDLQVAAELPLIK